MAEPSPAERALLSVYQQAERALLETATAQMRTLVDGDAASEVERRAAGVRTVQAATAGIVDRLNAVVPGLLGDALSAATDAGTAAAVAQLRGIAGGDAYTDRGTNRGALDRLAVALLERTDEVHRAILRVVPDRYRDAVARVLPAGLVGVETRRTMAQRAWWDLTNSGIATFTDRAGRNWRMSSYVEMATRTATARTQVDAMHDRLAADGRDLVIVQGSGDRCDRCRAWHGAILSVGGGGAQSMQLEHATRDDEWVDVDVAGSVDDARADGWGHPQCRCSTAAYLPGVTRIPDPLEALDVDEQYEARQRQRALERQIRGAKERQLAALDDAGRRTAGRQLAAANARMRAHLEANPDLLRRRYREQLGAGNIPTERTRAKIAADKPLDTVKVKPKSLTKMRDADVEREMNDALAREDYDRFDLFGLEIDRRDAARTARREATEARRQQLDEDRAAEMDRRMAAGDDEESAIEAVYGVSVERQRRDRAIGQLRGNGYEGKGFDELARAAFKDHVYDQMLKAEEATRGSMFSKRGQSAVTRNVKAGSSGGRPEEKLFTGSDSYVRANASPELLEWFDLNGRPNLDAFKADWLGEGGQFRRGQASGGDYYT